MNWLAAGAFVIAAVALLGSPGPGIAALVAVGRARGLLGGLRFYCALQLGLAIAAAISALGLASAITAAPHLHLALEIAATIYLLWLAWSIATAPVAGELVGKPASSAFGWHNAFLLGVANPKAYIAFASLMASFTLVRSSAWNMAAEWTICVVVMVTVDFAWLWLGELASRISLSSRAERRMNVLFALAIVIACALAIVPHT